MGSGKRSRRSSSDSYESATEDEGEREYDRDRKAKKKAKKRRTEETKIRDRRRRRRERSRSRSRSRSHSRSRSLSTACPYCQRIARNDHELRTHIDEKHLHSRRERSSRSRSRSKSKSVSGPPVVCPFCTENFPTKDQLKIHINFHHMTNVLPTAVDEHQQTAQLYHFAMSQISSPGHHSVQRSLNVNNGLQSQSFAVSQSQIRSPVREGMRTSVVDNTLQSQGFAIGQKQITSQSQCNFHGSHNKMVIPHTEGDRSVNRLVEGQMLMNADPRRSLMSNEMSLASSAVTANMNAPVNENYLQLGNELILNQQCQNQDLSQDKELTERQRLLQRSQDDFESSDQRSFNSLSIGNSYTSVNKQQKVAMGLQGLDIAGKNSDESDLSRSSDFGLTSVSEVNKKTELYHGGQASIPHAIMNKQCQGDVSQKIEPANLYRTQHHIPGGQSNSQALMNSRKDFQNRLAMTNVTNNMSNEQQILDCQPTSAHGLQQHMMMQHSRRDSIQPSGQQKVGGPPQNTPGFQNQMIIQGSGCQSINSNPQDMVDCENGSRYQLEQQKAMQCSGGHSITSLRKDINKSSSVNTVMTKNHDLMESSGQQKVGCPRANTHGFQNQMIIQGSGFQSIKSDPDQIDDCKSTSPYDLEQQMAMQRSAGQSVLPSSKDINRCSSMHTVMNNNPPARQRLDYSNFSTSSSEKTRHMLHNSSEGILLKEKGSVGSEPDYQSGFGNPSFTDEQTQPHGRLIVTEQGQRQPHHRTASANCGGLQDVNSESSFNTSTEIEGDSSLGAVTNTHETQSVGVTDVVMSTSQQTQPTLLKPHQVECTMKADAETEKLYSDADKAPGNTSTLQPKDIENTAKFVESLKEKIQKVKGNRKGNKVMAWMVEKDVLDSRSESLLSNTKTDQQGSDILQNKLEGSHDDEEPLVVSTEQDESDNNETLDTVEDESMLGNDAVNDTEGKPKKEFCPFCQVLLLSMEDCRQHINDFHVPKDYPCHLCEFRTTDRQVHADHVSNIHQSELQVKEGEQIPSDALCEAFKVTPKMSTYSFKKLIKDNDFVEVEVPGNGFCFQSALLVALSEHGINKTLDMLSIEMMSEIDQYYASVVDTGSTLGNYESFKKNCSSFFEEGDYTNEFVDVCIGVAANALGINLNIFQKTGNSTEMLNFRCQKFTSKVNLSLVFYNRKNCKKNTDCHYNVLLKNSYYKGNEQAVKSRMVVSREEEDFSQNDLAIAQALSRQGEEEQINNDFKLAKQMSIEGSVVRTRTRTQSAKHLKSTDKMNEGTSCSQVSSSERTRQAAKPLTRQDKLIERSSGSPISSGDMFREDTKHATDRDKLNESSSGGLISNSENKGRQRPKHLRQSKQLNKSITSESQQSNDENKGSQSESTVSESITDMLSSLDYVLVRIPSDEYENFFTRCSLFDVEVDAEPPVLSLCEETVMKLAELDKPRSNYTNGSKRASYVTGIGTKNMKYYGPEDLEKIVDKKDRKRAVDAMRSRRWRLEKRKREAALKTIRKKRSQMDPETLLKVRQKGKISVKEEEIGSEGMKSARKKIRQQRFRDKKKKRQEANIRKQNYRKEVKIAQNITNTIKSPVLLESSLDGCTIGTPPVYKKRIRQRVHTCKRQLPKEAKYRCHVLGRMVKKALLCEETRRTMTGILNQIHKTVPNRDNKALQTIYRRIIKYKTSKNYLLWSHFVKELKKRSSIREAAKKLNISYTTLQRLITKRDRGDRKITQEDKSRVIEFYSSSQISLQLPHKKYAKYHYLRSSLAVAYDQYVKAQSQSNGTILSKTTVYRCLKGKFRTRRKIPFKDCQCKTCVNNGLLVDALIVAGVKGISRSNTENVVRSYCPIQKQCTTQAPSRKLNWEGEGAEKAVLTDHDRACIFRECSKCGAIGLQETIRKANPDLNFENAVLWHQWEKMEIDVEKDSSEDPKKSQKKKLFDKILYSGSVAQLLALFTESIHNLSTHLFHFRWQAFQFDECKKLLQNGDVLMIMDFAQNHSHHRQDEVQSGLWSRKHSTLHPIVVYYPCQEESCHDLVKEELMMLSEDLNHDGFAVNSFIEKAIEHLKERDIPVQRLIMFSDNCGPQYKSCKVFETLSRTKIPVLRNYFGASHGKGEADGAIGRLSMTIDAVVRSGTFELGSCRELAAYCREYLTLGDHSRGMCCHYHRHYYEVSNIIRVQDKDIKGIRGTLGFHSVRNTGVHGVIDVRESSCFCEQCFLGAPGECRNKRLVKSFRFASLYKGSSAKQHKSITTINNKHWNGTTFKYVFVKGRFAKKRKILLKDKSSNIPNAKKQINILDEDFDSDDELDSDFEDDIPLSELIPDLNKSAICTRTRLNVKSWVRTKQEPRKLYLSDFEKSQERSVSSYEKEKNANGSAEGDAMMLSGVDPLSPVKQRKERVENDIVMIIDDYSSNDTFNAIKSSTPNKSQVMDLSEMQSGFISPIRHVPERESRVVPVDSIRSHSKVAKLRTELPKKVKEFGWKKLYNRFQSCKTYRGLEKIVAEDCKELPPLPEILAGEMHVTNDVVDTTAQCYLPKDKVTPEKYKHGYFPIMVSPDGNCCPRSFSRLVYGTESRHIEIRCRIVIDSVRNFDSYTNHQILTEGASHKRGRCSHIGEFYCYYSGVEHERQSNYTLKTIQNVFKKDIFRIRKEKEYFDVWQIHSAANVMNSKLWMLFPTKNIREDVRLDHHRPFLPLSGNFEFEFGLLWSSLREDARKYDHIVPLVKRETPVVLLKDVKHEKKKKESTSAKRNKKRSTSAEKSKTAGSSQKPSGRKTRNSAGKRSTTEEVDTENGEKGELSEASVSDPNENPKMKGDETTKDTFPYMEVSVEEMPPAVESEGADPNEQPKMKGDETTKDTFPDLPASVEEMPPAVESEGADPNEKPKMKGDETTKDTFPDLHASVEEMPPAVESEGATVTMESIRSAQTPGCSVEPQKSSISDGPKSEGGFQNKQPERNMGVSLVTIATVHHSSTFLNQSMEDVTTDPTEVVNNFHVPVLCSKEKLKVNSAVESASLVESDSNIYINSKIEDHDQIAICQQENGLEMPKGKLKCEEPVGSQRIVASEGNIFNVLKEELKLKGTDENESDSAIGEQKKTADLKDEMSSGIVVQRERSEDSDDVASKNASTVAVGIRTGSNKDSAETEIFSATESELQNRKEEASKDKNDKDQESGGKETGEIEKSIPNRNGVNPITGETELDESEEKADRTEEGEKKETGQKDTSEPKRIRTERITGRREVDESAENGDEGKEDAGRETGEEDNSEKNRMETDSFTDEREVYKSEDKRDKYKEDEGKQSEKNDNSEANRIRSEPKTVQGEVTESEDKPDKGEENRGKQIEEKDTSESNRIGSHSIKREREDDKSEVKRDKCKESEETDKSEENRIGTDPRTVQREVKESEDKRDKSEEVENNKSEEPEGSTSIYTDLGDNLTDDQLNQLMDKFEAKQEESPVHVGSKPTENNPAKYVDNSGDSDSDRDETVQESIAKLIDKMGERSREGSPVIMGQDCNKSMELWRLKNMDPVRKKIYTAVEFKQKTGSQEECDSGRDEEEKDIPCDNNQKNTEDETKENKDNAEGENGDKDKKRKSEDDPDSDGERTLEKFYKRNRKQEKLTKFPMYPLMPEKYLLKCERQTWRGVEIRDVTEGRGLFATKEFSKDSIVCNYGGHFVTEEDAREKLIPFQDKCDYLLEFIVRVERNTLKFYRNHDESTHTLGKFINHSSLHPNLTTRTYETRVNQLDVLFIAKKKIPKDTELLWDYGNSYTGVKNCVNSCSICKRNSWKSRFN